MATELNRITYKDVGTFDMAKVIGNFEILRDAMDETERLRAGLVDDVGAMYPASLSYAVEATGDYVVLPKTIRAEMRLSQVFIVAGADGEDTRIEVTLNNADRICEPITIKATEGRGKVNIGEPIDYMVITRFDEVTIHTDTNRKVVVTMNFEAVE